MSIRSSWVFGIWFGLLLGCDTSPREVDSPEREAVVAEPVVVDREPTASDRPERKPPKPQVAKQSIAFADIALASGLQFVFDTGARGDFLMPEATGGGAGWIDYDRDGQQDIFLVQGGDLLEPEAGDRLFRNTSTSATTRFSDVTLAADIKHRGYGHGVAIADFDGDGFEDIYVTNIDENVLLQNQGDGTFRDITEESGTGETRWSTSAAWGDLDGDGDLDLYVCNYLDYDVRSPFPCYSKSGKPAICNPSDLSAVENACFENLGDGRFRDRLVDWGLEAENSKSLGVVIADMNLDSRLDIYVANDVMPNLLFLANAEGGFREQGIAMGCAMSGAGLNQASMGIACEDYDNDGAPDLYVTHFSADSNTMYASLGNGFRDVTNRQGLHRPTLSLLGFGCSMQDFDCDGSMDLFVANGHVNFGAAGKMVPQLFSFDGKRWHETGGNIPCLSVPRLGRALAVGDVDRDGLPDLLMANQLDNVSLFSNRSETGNWLSVDLIGSAANRRGLGARVVARFGDRQVARQLVSGSSYCTSHESRLFFGLGDWSEPCELTVHWPWSDQSTQVVVEPNRQVTIRQPAELAVHTTDRTP